MLVVFGALTVFGVFNVFVNTAQTKTRNPQRRLLGTS